jgi:lipoate-protein ligase A
MGVPAEFQGRNDIVVDGKKISGNAQAWHKNKMLHHGTILFDADLDFVANVLNVGTDKIESKGIKSKRARVTNIRPYLKFDFDIINFKQKLLSRLLGSEDIINNTYSLSKEDFDRINKIQLNRYCDWNWNYGESPDSQVFKEKRYPGGKLQLYFDIKKGSISNFKIYGDFLNSQELSTIISQIENTLYEKSYLMEALKEIDFDKYFIYITKDELINCIID